MVLNPRPFQNQHLFILRTKYTSNLRRTSTSSTSHIHVDFGSSNNNTIKPCNFCIRRSHKPYFDGLESPTNSQQISFKQNLIVQSSLRVMVEATSTLYFCDFVDLGVWLMEWTLSHITASCIIVRNSTLEAIRLLQAAHEAPATAYQCPQDQAQLRQWWGRFLGILIGCDPCVCKSNRLHVDILRFFFINWGIFHKFL